MNRKYKFRDWPKRINIPDAVYFITFYTKQRYPFFKEPVLCDLFVENLKLCKRIKKFLLFGWVILYEHIHLLLMPDEQSDISDIMHYLKRHTSRNINIMMGYTSDPVSRDGYPDLSSKDDMIRRTSDVSLKTSYKIQCEDCHPHLQINSGTCPSTIKPCNTPVSRDGYRDAEGKFRITSDVSHKTSYNIQCERLQINSGACSSMLQPCNTPVSRDGYPDAKLEDNSSTEFIHPPSGIIKGMPRFKWQQSFYDRYMRGDLEFNNTLDYIQYNPDKHRLPDNWPYVFSNPEYDDLNDGIF